MGNFLERLERMTPERRSYALSMLVQHMYETRKWPQLFNCLDNVEYGQAKLRYDPSTHALAQDFDLGRRAAAQETCTLEEGIARLPHLWKYTWSRYTLAKQAGSYPLAAYKALLCLRGEQEVLNLIEVVNDPVRKMEVLHMVAQWLGEQTGREQERTQILLRVDEVVNTIVASAIKGEVKDWREFDDWYEIQPERASSMKEQALYELVLVLALARQWEGAERVIGVMKDFNWRQKALGELGQALAQAGQWERAERILDSVLIPMWRTNGLSDLGLALTQAGQAERAESLWTKAIADIDDMANLNWEDKAWSHLRPKLAQAKQYEPAYGIDYLELQLISINEKIYLGLTLALAGKRDRAEAVWTKAARLICDMADRGYKSDNVLHSLGLALIQARERDHAEYVIGNIEDSLLKAHGLSYLGWSLAQAQERNRAEAAWTEAERLIGYEEDSVKRDKAWHDLGVVLAQAGQAERTERVISNIGDNSQRVEVLSTLVQTLVKAGQAERAEVVWAEAKRIIGYKEEHFLKENALRQLGLTLMQEKQEDHAKVAWTEAKQIIYGMEDYTKREKERGLFSLGLTLTQAGQWNDAESLLSNLENAHWRDFKRRLQRLYDLVQDLIQGKKWENAEHVILLMKDTFNSNKSLCKLGIALAQEKQWEHAERVIHTIKDPLWRAYALSELGLILAQAQQEERAETVWTEAEHIVDTSKENSCRNLKLSLAQPEYWDQEEYWIGIEEDAYNIDKKWDPQQVNIKDEDQEDFFDSIWRT